MQVGVSIQGLTGAAGHGHGIASTQGLGQHGLTAGQQGLKAGQHGVWQHGFAIGAAGQHGRAADGQELHPQWQAAKLGIAPKANTKKVPKAISLFFIINFSFF